MVVTVVPGPRDEGSRHYTHEFSDSNFPRIRKRRAGGVSPLIYRLDLLNMLARDCASLNGRRVQRGNPMNQGTHVPRSPNFIKIITAFPYGISGIGVAHLLLQTILGLAAR